MGKMTAMVACLMWAGSCLRDLHNVDMVMLTNPQAVNSEQKGENVGDNGGSTKWWRMQENEVTVSIGATRRLGGMKCTRLLRASHAPVPYNDDAGWILFADMATWASRLTMKGGGCTIEQAC
jgi:hypothetical protein